MFGVILASISSIFSEVTDSTGKKLVGNRRESLYSFGFLTLFFGTVFFLISGFIRHSFVFSLQSLPTFLPRLVLEIIQNHLTLLAIVVADRGLFSFVRVLTVPLLLLADFSLGYPISPFQVGGIVLIILVIVALLGSEKFKSKGFGILVFIAVNAAVTISLFKYNITHFNSVEAEQGIVFVVLAIYFFILAMWKDKENPLTLLRHPIFFIQSVSNGLASVILSFAYFFAPASVVTTALRGFSVLVAVLSGRIFFRERRLLLKLFLLSLLVIGLVFLIL